MSTSGLDVGLGMFFIAATLSGSGFNPFFEITWPMNSTSASILNFDYISYQNG